MECIFGSGTWPHNSSSYSSTTGEFRNYCPEPNRKCLRPKCKCRSPSHLQQNLHQLGHGPSVNSGTDRRFRRRHHRPGSFCCGDGRIAAETTSGPLLFPFVFLPTVSTVSRPTEERQLQVERIVDLPQHLQDDVPSVTPARPQQHRGRSRG